MKKALFTLLLVAACCSMAMAQQKGSRIIVPLDTTVCQSFTWNVNGQTYTQDTVDTYIDVDTLYVLNLTVTQEYSDSVAVSVERCSYTWRGNTYTQSGTYRDTVVSPSVCDSTFILKLTVANMEFDTAVVNTCGEYIWFGDTLTISNSYSHNTYNADSSCLHVDLLNLNIVTQVDSYDTISHCGNYIWYNDTLATDGDYQHLLVDTVTLCDTLYHINLTIAVNETAVVEDSACNSRVWRGNTYDATGLYTVFDTNAATACVTKHTLNLRIKPFRTPVKDTTMVGCNSIRFTVSSILGSTNKTFTETTDFDTNITNRTWALCYDSTIHLHAIVKYSSSSDTTVIACDSFYWDRSKKTYKTSGNPKYTLADTNAAGCDSSLIMHLTIKKAPVISAINGEWRLSEGETARLYPTCTEGAVYRWTVTPNTATTTDGDTLIIPNVQGNIDVELEATINYSDVNFACRDTSWITIVTYVGIDDVKVPTVSLYPNPTVGQLNIESAEAISEVVVFNSLGQQVAVNSNLGNKGLINLSALSRGTYTMRIVMANGENVIRKFVITK